MKYLRKYFYFLKDDHLNYLSLEILEIYFYLVIDFS